MPLASPILDDRSYQQLRDELVRRIPVYNREWTDHNASDPGITLIELFAFLGENLLFRFNQIPEATKLAFLRLLQIPMRPAVAARSLVAATGTRPEGVVVPTGAIAKAGSLPFETTTEVKVWPLKAIAVARAIAPPPQSQEAQDFTQAAIDARGLQANEVPVYYLNERVPEDPSKPGATPVDFRSAVDGALWVAVLKTDDTSVDALGDALLNIGFIPDPQVDTIDEVLACPGEGVTTVSPQVVWHASTGELDTDTGDPIYRVLATEADTTRGLAQQGVVRLRLPGDVRQLGVPQPADPDLEGTGNLPPTLEDAKEAATVLFWLRAAPARADRPLGRIQWVGLHAAEVIQQRKARPEFLSTGNAQPGQVYQLGNSPVIEGSLVLEVEETERWVRWEAVDGFEESGEDSRHYILDREAATVRFGNGTRGRAPQIGERIRASEYRYGGGAAGNVAAKAISKFEPAPDYPDVVDLKLTNPLPARGGAPAETIVEALDRVPGELRRRDRAVTAGDFQELALQTPGANVGRAECLPLFHPPTRKPDAAGVVSVVVWPREDRQHPGAPMPDRDLLRSVCCWLDARRLVTTELWVIPPTYRKIAVAVGIAVKAGFGAEAVRRWVELVLRQYLAPLPPYGREGRGWPLGWRVYGPELDAAALQVEGVDYIQQPGIRVSSWDETERRWIPGTVDLEAWEVPELHEITVVEGEPMLPGVALGFPPEPAEAAPPAGPSRKPPLPGRSVGAPIGKVPVPIPTIREAC